MNAVQPRGKEFHQFSFCKNNNNVSIKSSLITAELKHRDSSLSEINSYIEAYGTDKVANVLNLLMKHIDTDNFNGSIEEITNVLTKHYNKSKKVKKRNVSGFKSNGVAAAKAAEPLNDTQVKTFAEYLLDCNSRHKYRNYMMFAIQLNTGRRIGDVLRLRINDVYNVETHTVKECIRNIWEEKTDKLVKRLAINEWEKEAIELYIHSLKRINPSEYLFLSQKLDDDGNKKPIDEQQAWDIVNDVKKATGIDVNGGTHLVRKSFADKLYNDSPNERSALTNVQYSLNHASSATSMRYINKPDKEIFDITNNFKWFDRDESWKNRVKIK